MMMTHCQDHTLTGNIYGLYGPKHHIEVGSGVVMDVMGKKQGNIGLG